ncbi:polymer-forming cytoskeletal protein [Candidatus Bathyarchaeota archaeon]|nr:polymer-forming cytoskeletal protein [Candidatus Bathyarchaeota archaeon]
MSCNSISGEEKFEQYEKKLAETVTIPTTRISGSGKVHIKGIGEVSVAGAGYISPEEIKISGSGRLPGGLKVKKISCAGSIGVEGNIEAEDLILSGSTSIAGNVKAGKLAAAGSLSINGGVSANFAEFAGSCRIGSKIEVDDLRASGFLRVLDDITAKNLADFHGAFDIDGRVSTGRFEARLSRSVSHVKGGIKAGNVTVKRRGREGIVIFGIPILTWFSREGRLHTTNIESEGSVYLERVTCESVLGKSVSIGEDCIVKEVKYLEAVTVHPTAKLATSPKKVCEK